MISIGAAATQIRQFMADALSGIRTQQPFQPPLSEGGCFERTVAE